MKGQAKILSLFESLFELRRREPSDDIISHLLAAEGDQIQPDEMRPLCMVLLIAGFETTVNLIGNGVLALLAHPEQWHELSADPDGLAPRVVEETLRFDPPVQRTSRYALEDLELEGTPVRKGQEVTTLLGAANRDPEAYDNPTSSTSTARPRATTWRSPAGSIIASEHRWPAGGHHRLPHARRADAGTAPHRAGARRNSTAIRGPLRIPVSVAPVRALCWPPPDAGMTTFRTFGR